MNQTPDFHEFYKHPFIQSIAQNERWTVSDSKKVPIDMYMYIYKKRVTGAIYNDEASLVNLETLRQTLPNAANNAYYLDALIDKFVVLDIEPKCPETIKKQLLKLPYIYGELSMSGKGYHLIFPLPDCITEYPTAQKKIVMKEEHGYYEILMCHYVTFTRNMLPPSDNKDAKTFEDIFRTLASEQKETTKKDITIDKIEPVETTYSEKIIDLLSRCGKNYKKTLADFENDRSRYEFAFIAHLYWNLKNILKISAVENDHTYTESEQAWFLYHVASKKLPKREKHSECRYGLPWLLYLSREVMANCDANEEEKAKKKNKED